MYEIYNFCCKDWPYFICPNVENSISAADTSNFHILLSFGNSPFLHYFIIGERDTIRGVQIRAGAVRIYIYIYMYGGT